MDARRIAFVLTVSAALAGFVGCATQKGAVREMASRDLGCPDDEIKLKRDDDGVYNAAGCGHAVRIACHDPYASTGASWGWSDPLTAGNRSKRDRLLDAPAAVAKSAPSATANAAPPTGTGTLTSAPAVRAPSEFDRALAGKLLSAAAERAGSCRAPGGLCVTREMERVSLPAFTGDPVQVLKTFVVR